MVDRQNDTVVLYPSPGKGHLYSTVELGKLIINHHPSISVTIILSTLPNQTTSSSDPYFAAVSAATPSISFIHFPAAVSLPPTTPSSSHEHVFLTSLFDLARANNPILKETLLTLSESSNIKAFIIDFFCTASVQVSSHLNIPTYFFITSGPSALCVFIYFSSIDKIAETSFKDQDVILDVPGIPKISSQNLPVVVRDRSHRIYQYFVDTSIQMARSSGLIINTFESLEQKAINAMVAGKCTPDEPAAPPVYCVGPLVANGESVGHEHECLYWLDRQPSRSVLFLCFGSMGVLSASQLKEIAVGLERSGVRFLWVVRYPPADNQTGGISPPTSELESLFPDGFMERTKGRGFVAISFAPQVAVLNHGSVGGFVTHCGWNSILEAVCAGVPMLAWPLYAEQKLNRFFVVEEMKVGLAITISEEGFVSGFELEERVRELMISEKGKEVRERVAAMREWSVEAFSHGGSSTAAVAKLVGSFKQRNSF